MRRIALSAGHQSLVGRDRGAVSPYGIEGNVAEELKLLVRLYLAEMGIKASIDPKDSVTKQTVNLFRQYFSGGDICLDIHFNSSTNPNASGTECVVPLKATDFEKELATELSGVISAVLNIRNRGVITEAQTYRKKLMWMTLPCEAVLIEICFLSNKHDMEVYNLRKHEVARNIAAVLAKYRK